MKDKAMQVQGLPQFPQKVDISQLLDKGIQTGSLTDQEISQLVERVLKDPFSARLSSGLKEKMEQILKQADHPPVTAVFKKNVTEQTLPLGKNPEFIRMAQVFTALDQLERSQFMDYHTLQERMDSIFIAPDLDKLNFSLLFPDFAEVEQFSKAVKHQLEKSESITLDFGILRHDFDFIEKGRERRLDFCDHSVGFVIVP